MHILLIGATGSVGKFVLTEALSRSHTVTAMVRDPTAVTAREGLTIIKGDGLNPSNIDTAFSALPANDEPKAVIVTLGWRLKTSSPFSKPLCSPTFMKDVNENVIEAMKKKNHLDIRKLVILQAYGVADSYPSLFFAMKLMLRWSTIGSVYEDHEAVDRLVRGSGSGLDWVMVRPTRLTDGEKAPVQEFGDQGVGIGSFAGISRASVAAFLVDAAEGEKWTGKTPVIAN